MEKKKKAHDEEQRTGRAIIPNNIDQNENHSKSNKPPYDQSQKHMNINDTEIFKRKRYANCGGEKKKEASFLKKCHEN